MAIRPRTIAAIELARLYRFVEGRHPRCAALLPPAPYRGATERELWDERLPDQTLFDIWAHVARLVQRPALPIEFAASTRLEHLGLFGLAIRTAPTADEALERTMRFQRLFTDSGAIHIETRQGEVFWSWLRPGARTLGLRLANEVALAEQVALVRQLLPQAAPLRVQLRHRSPADDSEHRRFFACPIEWGATEEGLGWSPELFARPLLEVDEALSRYFHDEAGRRLEALGAPSIAARTREVVAQRLSAADVAASSISAAVGLSPRQLRQALASEGTNLKAIIDTIRRETARTLVDSGRHSMTEIAFLLGLSETSALSRAFRRWFGVAPARARRSTRPSRRSSTAPRRVAK